MREEDEVYSVKVEPRSYIVRSLKFFISFIYAEFFGCNFTDQPGQEGFGLLFPRCWEIFLRVKGILRVNPIILYSIVSFTVKKVVLFTICLDIDDVTNDTNE